jgi:hypothetical protein
MTIGQQTLWFGCRVLKDTSIPNIPIINQEILWYQEKIDLYNLHITLLNRARHAYKGVKTNNIF